MSIKATLFGVPSANLPHLCLFAIQPYGFGLQENFVAIPWPSTWKAAIWGEVAPIRRCKEGEVGLRSRKAGLNFLPNPWYLRQQGAKQKGSGRCHCSWVPSLSRCQWRQGPGDMRVDVKDKWSCGAENFFHTGPRSYSCLLCPYFSQSCFPQLLATSPFSAAP